MVRSKYYLALVEKARNQYALIGRGATKSACHPNSNWNEKSAHGIAHGIAHVIAHAIAHVKAKRIIYESTTDIGCVFFDQKVKFRQLPLRSLRKIAHRRPSIEP